MTLRILQFGATGQLARELTARAAGRGAVVEAVSRDQIDLTDVEAVEAIIERAEVDLVVNAAAYTAVDRAETDQEAAFAVNAAAPAAMARACDRRDLPFIHVSTDYVFNGEKDGAWVETDPIDPINLYGQSKARGEADVLSATSRALILRTSWVFSPYGANFVKTMLRIGAERPELKVVGDQAGCPTAAGDIAEFILQAAPNLVNGADASAFGIFHFSGDGPTTWSGFAEAIFDMANGETRPAVVPITTAEYPTPARRPRNSVLDCGHLTNTFGVAPRDWRAGLAETLAALGRYPAEARP